MRPNETGERTGSGEHRRTDDHTEMSCSDDGKLLHTPEEAARILTIKESWLRRKAGTGAIPSTLVGKHLRFSETDLRDIVERFHRPSRAAPHRSARSRKPSALHTGRGRNP
jgi:excisionase family DNA binding protein